MVKKKRKRRSLRKKTVNNSLLVLFVLLLAGIAILTTGLYLASSTGRTPLPPYEETYSKNSELNREIGRIDTAIYESLYQRAIPAENVVFVATQPKFGGHDDWDFTELTVKLSTDDSFVPLEKLIGVELSGLGPEISYRRSIAPKGDIVYHIFARGFCTHKIRLAHGGGLGASHSGLPRVGLLIDDLGYDLDVALSFLRLDLPVSFSVLPQVPYTESIVEQANKRGRELILHVPMEPENYPSINPGPGALFTDMDEGQLRHLLSNHLRQVSGARGVNNHMGSRFTKRLDKMAVVLRELKRQDLFYVDSRTTSQTLAFEMARTMGVPVARRSVFLDNDLAQNAIRFQMERLLSIARHKGLALGIGHPHRETLHVIKNYMHKLRTEVRVVPVSRLVG